METGFFGFVEAMASAGGLLFEPTRLWYVLLGVFFGILVAVVPGLGGLVGISLLLPFTFSMDAYSGVAFLLAVITVMSTSDTIPAILFGVPGTPTSMATVVDGYPMARKGQAGRALGAAFSASVIGGIFGALLLLFVIPVMIPVMLAMTSAELLAFCIMGLAMVAALSGGSLYKGLGAAAIGMLIAFVGQDAQTATLRWSGDVLYLWDGLHILIIALGLYAIPELADLAIQRSAIAPAQGAQKGGITHGALDGLRDTARNMPLVARSSGISAVLGAVPALGPAVIPWIVYSMATVTTKGKTMFGKGDVRGVIAAESSNNATVGGSLLPTIALGIPGSAPMALLIGALMIQGIAPGPDMLAKNLDLTYLMVWTIVLANILGGIMAFGLSNQLARVVTVPASVLVPLVIAVVFVGTLQASRQWEDLFFLLAIGAIGWIMKRAHWSRSPLLLAFVLAPLVEKYFHIAYRLHGWEWAMRPIALTLLVLTAVGLVVMGWRRVRANRIRRAGQRVRLRLTFGVEAIVPVAVVVLGIVALVTASDWPWRAAIMPQIVAVLAIVAGLGALVGAWSETVADPTRTATDGTDNEPVHYDITTDFGELAKTVIWARGAAYLAWLAAFVLVARVIGVMPAVGFFLVGYMLTHGTGWKSAFCIGIPAWAMAWFVFESTLQLAWPVPLLSLFQ